MTFQLFLGVERVLIGGHHYTNLSSVEDTYTPEDRSYINPHSIILSSVEDRYISIFVLYHSSTTLESEWWDRCEPHPLSSTVEREVVV